MQGGACDGAQVVYVGDVDAVRAALGGCGTVGDGDDVSACRVACDGACVVGRPMRIVVDNTPPVRAVRAWCCVCACCMWR